MPQATATPSALALDDLYPLDKLIEAYPHLLTMETLRWQLRHRSDNGLAPACVRLGRRLMISKSRYETWLASRAG